MNLLNLRKIKIKWEYINKMNKMDEFDIIEKFQKGKKLKVEEAAFIEGKYAFNTCFPFQYAFSQQNKVGEGNNGFAYDVLNPSGLIVKIAKKWEGDHEIIHGQEIQEYFESKGISVPHTLGTFNVYDRTDQGVKIGHVMEKVYGKHPSILKGEGLISMSQYSDIIKLMRAGRKELEKLGHKSHYVNGHAFKNTIWDIEKEKLFFVDFDNDHISGKDFAQFVLSKNKLMRKQVA